MPYLLNEDGSGFYELEDNSGFLEAEPSMDAPFIAATTSVFDPTLINPELPTYVGLNSFGSISAVNAPYPASLVAGDILLLLVETADENCGTPNGWLKIGEVSNTGQTRLTVFMHRWVSGTSVGVFDSGDHQIGYVIAIRGASAKLPIFTTDSGTETGAGQTQSMDGPTTTVNDCFIVIATSHNLDVSTSTTYSAWTNANLEGVTERADGSSIAGNGGGMGIATATLSVAGAVGTSTVVNSLTSPAWTSMVIAFAPPTPPPNDLFSNAEPLSDGLTQAVAGTTYDATTESGEDVTGLFGATVDRTQWWSYDATIRQIVKYRMVVSVGALGQLGSYRGASVSTATKYSIPAYATSGTTAGFGQEAERGLKYEYLFSEAISGTTYNRAQVDPDHPLLVQTGRRVNAGFVDFTYDVEFESFTPPANDDFDDAEEITFPDLDPIDIVYDLEPATSQPGYLGLSYVRSIGDLWYHINLATDTPVGIGIIKNNIVDNAYPICAIIWQGTSLGALTYGGIIRGSYYNTADNLLVQRTFYAGYDYYIQLLHDVAQYDWGAETGTLQLQPYAIPPNDNFVDAEDLGTADSGYTLVATTQGASVETGEPNFLSYSVWYEFTPTNGGWYEFEAATNPPTGWSLHAYRGVAVNALTWVSGLSYQTQNPKLIALRGGETYHIHIGGVSWDFGQLTWDRIASVPSNDDIANATVITGASGSEPADIEGATREAGEFDDWPIYIDQEVTTWFEWVCPSTAYYSFETSSLGANGYERAIAVWETDTTGDPLVENLDGKDFDKGKLAFSATATETYYIRVTLGRQYPVYTFTSPYTFDFDWATFVPATDNLFANATPVAAEYTDSLALNNYGLPLELEVDFPPSLLEIFQEEEFGVGYGQIGRVRWLDFVPEVTGTYDFDIEANGSQILMHMYIGDELDELLPVVAIDGAFDTAGTYDDHQYGNGPFTVELVEGESYKIVIAGFLWDDAVDDPPHWMSQGDFTISWMLHPEENDTYSVVLNTNDDNVGNLNWIFEYQYPGYDDDYGTTYASGGSRTVRNLAATSQVGELAVDGYGPVRTLWFTVYFGGVDNYTTDQGDYRIWIEGTGPNPCLDPVMAVYDQTGSNIASPGTLLGSDDDTNGLYPEVILDNRFAFDSVLIQVDARDEGEFTIHYRRIPPGSPPANDDFDDAIEVFDSVPFAVNAVHATVEYGELPVAGFADGPWGSVWYKFLPTLDQSAQVVINNDWPGSMSLDYLYVDIYHGTTIENLVNITPADDFYNGAFNEILDPPVPFSVQAGETYYLRFSAYGDQAWSGATATLTAFGDDLYAPFISPTTTLYTPSLLGQLPFIAPTTTLFSHYLSGAMDIPAPFIDLTGSAFTPYLVSSNRARLSQEAVEVLLLPDAEARISQVAVEVLLFVDTAKARLSQEAIEVLFLPASAEIEARLTQLPVEVIKRVLHESVAITIID